MEQNAKQLLKRISEKVETLADNKISQVAHAPRENEWRAYIWQKAPWKDIAWRVKEPNIRGEAEVHLGFYSSKPDENLSTGIDKTEMLAKGKVSHVLKNENGISLVWKVNFNELTEIETVERTIMELLPEFISLALSYVIKAPETNDENINETKIGAQPSKSDSIEQGITENNPIDEYVMKTGLEFFEWIKNLKNANSKTEDNPSPIYQNICKNLEDLCEIGFIDENYYYCFEEKLKDKFSKELSVFRSGLEEWYSSLSSDMISDLESETYVEDYEFTEELHKIWHIFLYWGAMYTGEHHPKHPLFITLFKYKDVQQVALKILVESITV